MLGEEFDLTKYDPRRFDARTAANNLLNPPDEDEATEVAHTANGSSNGAVSMDKRPAAAEPAPEPARVERPRPRPRPHPAAPPATPFDDDAT